MSGRSLSRWTLDILKEEGFTRRQWIAWCAEWLGATEPVTDWWGDRCGCPDDRCIGYHHGPGVLECGCRDALIRAHLRGL